MKVFTKKKKKKTAQQFFDLIRNNDIEMLIDIRLNNSSQLSGFAKGIDLPYFLQNICKCEYKWVEGFCPTQNILKDYKSKKITWEEYEKHYISILNARHAEDKFKRDFSKFNKVCLLCSESEPSMCHRRLLAEYLQKNINGIEIQHL